MIHTPSRRLTAPLTFLLPCLMFLALCAAMGFAPFGESSILIFDLSDQFVEFLCGLKQGNVYFSWYNALGGSYIGTFSYDVSSPFSLLTLLCPDEAMPVAVVFLVALKLGLAGLTFGLLLRRRTGRYDLTTAAFSLCYGLMAYNIAYAMSFMWLDGVIWLPVLLLGAEDLLDGRRSWVLLGGLVVSFLSTWYISYMTGIFCALYLLWQCACRGLSPRRSLAKLGQLALWALLALALTAWLWLPTALSMFSGKLAGPGAGRPAPGPVLQAAGPRGLRLGDLHRLRFPLLLPPGGPSGRGVVPPARRLPPGQAGHPGPGRLSGPEPVADPPGHGVAPVPAAQQLPGPVVLCGVLLHPPGGV